MKRNEYEDSFLLCTMKNNGYLVEKDPYDIEYKEDNIETEDANTLEDQRN